MDHITGGIILIPHHCFKFYTCASVSQVVYDMLRAPCTKHPCDFVQGIREPNLDNTDRKKKIVLFMYLTINTIFSEILQNADKCR